MSIDGFASQHYQDHNAARLEHLASLGLPLTHRRVLEVGSGPGDHTSFYLDRGCSVVSIDAREECVVALRDRYPQVTTHVVDMDSSIPDLGCFDIVHAYGILYHLSRPAEAIAAMAGVCNDFLLLETCVSHYEIGDVNFVSEDALDATQAAHGLGCRPTRKWVFAELEKHFLYVYQTRTQPKHPEFPVDWTQPPAALSRAVFVGSRTALDENVFSSELT